MVKGIIVVLALFLFVAGHTQTEHWEKIKVSGFELDFPSAYVDIKTSEATGVSYNGGNLFITVTSLPDENPDPPKTKMEYRKRYGDVLHKVVRRLRGKLLAATDTTFQGFPAYHSRIKVPHGDEKFTEYEMLQVMYHDSIHAFSCQFEAGTEAGVAARDRFFNGIRGPYADTIKRADKSRGLIWGVWVGCGLLGILLLGWLFRKGQSPEHIVSILF